MKKLFYTLFICSMFFVSSNAIDTDEILNAAKNKQLNSLTFKQYDVFSQNANIPKEEKIAFKHNHKGKPALIESIIKENFEAFQELVKYLKDNNIDFTKIKDKKGNNVFHYASIKKSENYIKFLLNNLSKDQNQILIFAKNNKELIPLKLLAKNQKNLSQSTKNKIDILVPEKN